MFETENWMDTFRTQKRENVYVLTVKITEKENVKQVVKEVVDCPAGEVGAWYANNLLFRLANEALRGTEFERILWRERRVIKRASSKDYAYEKKADAGKYVIADMKWYQQLPEE